MNREIKFIKRYHIDNYDEYSKEGYSPLIEHLKVIWWAADWGFVSKEGRSSFDRKKVLKLELHTGGWGGNEEIIQALQNTFFWTLFWVSSRRGGHYSFEIPIKYIKANNAGTAKTA